MRKRQSTAALSRASVSRGFNTLGLMSSYLQWMWVAIVCLPSVLKSDLLVVEAPVNGVATQESIANSLVDSLGPFQSIIGFIVIILTVIFIVYAIKRSSGVVTSSTEEALDSTTDYILPKITHGKKISKDKQKRLTLRIKFLIKCALSVLAFLVLPFTAFLPIRAIDMSFVIAVGLILLPWSIIWFSLARVFQIDPMKPHN